MNIVVSKKKNTQVATNNNRKPISINPWLIWFTAGLFYVYEVVLRTGPSVMTQGIMDSFQLNATHLGLLTVFFYYAYVLCQIPSGMLLDKYGARTVVTISSLLCAMGAIMFGSTDNLHVAQIARFLIGAGSACGFIVCLKLASEWFSPSKFAFIAGLSNMLGTLGATFAGMPLAYLVNLVGWQQAMIFLGYLGVIVTFLCWAIVRNRPHYKPNTKPIESVIGLRKSLLVIIFDKQILLAGIIGGLMYVPITSFAELWGVPFLSKSLHISNEFASFANTMIFVGMAIGSPIIAKLAFKQKSYIKLMKRSALAGALFFTIISFANKFGYYPSILILFISGMWLGGQVLCFSIVKEKVPNKISGTAMAYTNALVMLGGVIFQPLMGFILDLGWQGDLDNIGRRLYNLEAYQQAIFTIPVCLILSWGLLKLCRDYAPKE